MVSWPRTWLITGCSTGFGRALAVELLDAGERVAVSARRVSTIEDLVATSPDRAVALTLDVTDTASAEAAVQAAEARFGGVDVLINNAGYSFFGGIEATAPAEYRRLFDTNFFGALTMTQAVLPGMRRRRSGFIVNIGSTSAINPSPGMSFYAAAKCALSAITETLAKEGAPLGIRAMIVEAGLHRTQSLAQMTRAARTIEDYGAVSRMNDLFEQALGHEPGDPRRAARAIIAAVMADEPPLHLPLGPDALERSRGKVRQMAEEVEKWADVARSTVFDPAAN